VHFDYAHDVAVSFTFCCFLTPTFHPINMQAAAIDLPLWPKHALRKVHSLEWKSQRLFLPDLVSMLHKEHKRFCAQHTYESEQ